jgi:hypothetical protein
MPPVDVARIDARDYPYEDYPYRCADPGCARSLRAVSNDAIDDGYLDWTYVDQDGGALVDRTPPILLSAGTMEALAEVDIRAYSAIRSADYHLAGWSTHRHRPAPSPRPSAHHCPVPRCHDLPMWDSPKGWRCRARAQHVGDGPPAAR